MAFELFGKCWFGKCETDEEVRANEDGQVIDPKRYSVDFETGDQVPEKVQNVVKNASQLWLERDKAVAGSAGLIARAKGDYRRILAALYNSGYYGGSISITVNGQQAAQMPMNTSLDYESSVAVKVDPGEVYHFGKAEILNRAPPSDDPEDQVPNADKSEFETGQIAKAGEINLAGSIAVNSWRQLGYPKAKIASREATADHPRRILDVLLNAEPGPHAEFGDLRVSGTVDMDPEFVAYMADIQPGTEFDPDVLKKAKKRIDRLGVFSSRQFVEGEHVNNGILPIELVVSEKKKHRIGLGASLSSIDGAALETYWLHRNLFGRAESLKLEGNLGGIDGSGGFNYLFSATYLQPGTFSPDTDMSANVFAKREDNDTYTETAQGGSIGVIDYHSDTLTFSGSLFGEFSRFQDAFGTRDFAMAGLKTNVTYDGRDDKLEPTKGYYARLDASPVYEWRYGNAAARLEAEGRTYFDFSTEGKTVIAGRVKIGSLLGPSIRETPPSMLFTAGGGSSVRGYDYKSIGIRGPNGDTVAGASLLELNGEWRQRINDSFGLVVFADAGLVDHDSFVDFSNDMKVGIGVGLRYYTSLGPIRLDVAFPLDRGPDDSGFGIYAGIGQAF